MPITFTPGPPLAHIGPGLPMRLHTDVTGELPFNAQWHVTVSAEPEGAGIMWVESWLGGDPQQTHFWLSDPNRLENFGFFAVADGQAVHVQAEVLENGVVVDTGSTNAPFDSSAGLGMQAELIAIQQRNASGGLGFTETDRLLLEQIDATSSSTRSAVTTSVQTATGIITADLGAAWKWVSQDLWRNHPLTIGPTCDRIDVDVSLNALLGVVLTIDNFPESVVLRTPDGEWSFADLAVLKFVRNGEILERHGIHTLTHTVSPLPGCVWIGAYGLGAPIQPTGYHITVDWLDGVCGHLTGLILPI